MTFGLVKHNNNSISAITSAGQLAQGKMTLLQTQTASSSASISFTSNIDSTYPIYLFKFINIHPATNNAGLSFNFSVDSGSNYNVTKTTTAFRAYNNESHDDTALSYETGHDLAQSTSFQKILHFIGNGNDESGSGEMFLFDPSSSVFVKHFMAIGNTYFDGTHIMNDYTAGYGNTTSAVNAIQFKMSSGNIDSGTIKLYGIKGS